MTRRTRSGYPPLPFFSERMCDDSPMEGMVVGLWDTHVYDDGSGTCGEEEFR